MKQLLHTLAFFLVITSSAFSQTVNEWNGDGDATSWDDPDNWELDVVPNNTHKAEIKSGAIINISGSQEVDQLFIDNATTIVQVLVGASLTINENPTSVLELHRGSFKNFGDLEIVRFKTLFNVQSYFTNESSGTITLVHNGNNGNDSRFEVEVLANMTNYGTMHLEGTSDEEDVIFNRGLFINEGEINISGAFKRGLANFSNGEFINESGATLNAGREFPDGPNSIVLWTFNEMENHGTINVVHPTDPDADMDGIGLYIDAFASFENTGTINISHMNNYGIWYNHDWDNTGTLNLGSTNNKTIGNSEQFPSELNNTSGTINASGLFKCHEGLTGGTLNIGDSPGEVTFQVSQDLSTVYTPLEIAGTDGPGDPNGHDVIYGDRQNSFFDLVDIELGDADLDIYLIGGFQPVYNDEFLLVKTDGELTGQFGIIGFPALTDPNLFWEMDYDYPNDEVWFRVNAFVVPVELSDFDVRKRGENHLLNWTTESEINSSHFEIQTSSNMSEWKSIGNIESNGNSSSAIDYSFEYRPNQINDIYFYRLKMIDFDGSYEYSEIKSIRGTTDTEVSAYPNPFTDEIEINSPSGFYILNTIGEIVFQSTESNATVDFTNHPSGIYYVVYSMSTRKAEKIIKL